MDESMVAMAAVRVYWTLLFLFRNGTRLAKMIGQTTEVNPCLHQELHPVVSGQSLELRTIGKFVGRLITAFAEHVAFSRRGESLRRIFLLRLLRIVRRFRIPRFGIGRYRRLRMVQSLRLEIYPGNQSRQPSLLLLLQLSFGIRVLPTLRELLVDRITYVAIRPDRVVDVFQRSDHFIDR